VSVNVGRLGTAASAFISKPHKLLIDGRWIVPKGGKSFKVFDPATGVQIAQVAEGVPEDIDLAVKAARKAFEEGPWSKIKPVERGKMVWRLGYQDQRPEHSDLRAGRLARLFDARACRCRGPAH